MPISIKILLIHFLSLPLLQYGHLLAENAPPQPAASIEKLVEKARPSVAVVTFLGRDGKVKGQGTGFVVDPGGLLATNLHVIGEARPIKVEFPDGKKYDVISVHASDRSLDLALLRIERKGLPALPLGDSDALKDGRKVVALGNPHGLKHSVVAGLVSGRRKIESQLMIQLAIPIEPGNSGGPVLDMEGRVLGIMTIKSAVTPNLGFAVPVNSLKALINLPNPIAISRWLTIGALDSSEWQPVFGSNWRQRAGRIVVDEWGKSFGGRALCLYQQPNPKVPFEMAVDVKLDDEAGAAGLVFHSDGKDKHYGFYPTGGRMRLTRFDGPSVFTWKILDQAQTPHYIPGEWNTLMVRIEKERIRCFVNNHTVFESADRGLTAGKVGLAKFRNTLAEFKRFRVAGKIKVDTVPEMVRKKVTGLVQDLKPSGVPDRQLIEILLPNSAASMQVLRQRARLLEGQADSFRKQAEALRKLTRAVHSRKIQKEIVETLSKKEEQIDLFRIALLIASLDNDELDLEAYQDELDVMVSEVLVKIPKGAAEIEKLETLQKYLFTEGGFHGSRTDYYNRSNSYMNEVIDDREGLPITLSVLTMELGRRIGLTIEGVGMPGHFIVRFRPEKGEPLLLDPFGGGAIMSRSQANKKIQEITGRPLRDQDLATASKRDIILRMLQNLIGLAGQEEDIEGVLRYLDVFLAISPSEAQQRWRRAALRNHAGDKKGALEDTDWLLQRQPLGVNIKLVEQFKEMLRRQGN